MPETRFSWYPLRKSETVRIKIWNLKLSKKFLETLLEILILKQGIVETKQDSRFNWIFLNNKSLNFWKKELVFQIKLKWVKKPNYLFDQDIEKFKKKSTLIRSRKKNPEKKLSPTSNSTTITTFCTLSKRKIWKKT